MTRTSNLESLRDIVSLTLSGGDQDRVIQGIIRWTLDYAGELFPVSAFTILYYEETGTMRLSLGRTVQEPPGQQRLAGSQVEDLKPLLQEPPAKGPWHLPAGDARGQPVRELVGASDDSQLYGFPLQVSDRTYGMLGIRLSAGTTLEQKLQKRMAQYSRIAGVCLENAQLYEAQARQARELQHQDDLRRSYISFMTHEFRTPLASLKTSFELIQEAETIQELADPYQRLIVNVNRSVDSLDQLINDMAEVANLASGGVLLNKAPVAPGEVLYPVIEIAAPLSQVKNQRLEVTVPPDLPKLMADGHRLGQVLTNMVSNAIKYTPAGGLIRATVTREADCVRFGVSDTGEGIPEEHLPHIFDPFYRVPRPQGKRPPGTGLGLALARSLVELHGGRIWAESRPDQGSTFYFTIPIDGRKE